MFVVHPFIFVIIGIFVIICVLIGTGRRAASPYTVEEIDSVLTPAECDALIAFAKERGLKPSDILSNKLDDTKGTIVDEKSRTSETAWISDDDHPIIQKLADRAAALTGLPVANQEMAQVAHYTVGGKFNAHYDACNSDKAYCAKMNRHAGQRRATLLVYLNDDFEGGQTVFTRIGKTVTPKTGMGILFWNTTAETDAIIPESMHQGNPVLCGEKWICTKWTHSKAYPHHAL
jgi:prolyl 4-hydroxylase